MEAGTPVAHSSPVRRGRHRVFVVGCGLAAAALAVAAGALGAAADTEHGELVAAARALIVGLPMAVGLYAWHREPTERFGMLLVVTGLGCAVATLSELDGEVPYTIGRIAGWLVEVLFVYLVLSFPSGRLPERIDRWLVGAMAAVLLALFVPRLALAEDFPVPAPFSSCTEGCPGNALFLLEEEPAIVDAFLRPAGTLLTIAVLVAVLVRLRERMRGATPLARRVHTPVFAVAAARVALLPLGFVVREIDHTAWPVEAVSWSLALAIPALALAFLVGLVRWRLFGGEALRHLAEWLSGRPDTETVRQALAEAFDDPDLQIVFSDDGASGRWRDAAGRPVTMPGPGSGRSFSEIDYRGTPVAALIYDAELRGNSSLLDAGIAIAGVVLENARLTTEADSAAREARRSRARMTASAERERRRIERDLHDGAQQRLVALRIELELAEELVRVDVDRGVDRLRELELQVDEALEELRSLAHGVYPSLLADRGLVDALETAASRSSVPVDVQAHAVVRYPPEVESAVYFCVLEALQNADKHAEGARRVLVRLEGGLDGELMFKVRDDGAGAAGGVIRPGAGVTNMRDRLTAVGGQVAVSSRQGVGTTVEGRVPPRTAVSE
jgi:signal transduction histidine kinase